MSSRPLSFDYVIMPWPLSLGLLMCLPVLYTVTPFKDVNIHISSAEVSAVTIAADIKVYDCIAGINESSRVAGSTVTVVILAVRGNDVHFSAVGYLSRVYGYSSRHSGCTCGAGSTCTVGCGLTCNNLLIINGSAVFFCFFLDEIRKREYNKKVTV